MENTFRFEIVGFLLGVYKICDNIVLRSDNLNYFGKKKTEKDILVLNTITGNHWFCRSISFEFDKEFAYAYAHFKKWFRLDPNRKKEEEKKPLLIWKCDVGGYEFERHQKLLKVDLSTSRFSDRVTDSTIQARKESREEVLNIISKSFHLLHKVYYPTSYEYTFYKGEVMKKTVQNFYLSPEKQDDTFSLYLATISDTIFKDDKSHSPSKVILYSLNKRIRITPIESVIILNNTPLKTSSFRYRKRMDRNAQIISHNTRTRFTFSGDISLSFYTDYIRRHSTSITNYPYIIISQSVDSEEKQDLIKISNPLDISIDEHESCTSYTNK